MSSALLRSSNGCSVWSGTRSRPVNRGTFVRVPDTADVIDLYRVRKHVECAVLRPLRTAPADLSTLRSAVQLGEQALAEQDWQALGTANIQFHEALVALADSERITELMRAVLAELRLVFHVMDNPRWFHQPYLARNQDILAALAKGDGERAADLLHDYLDDAEHQLVKAYAPQHTNHLR